MHHADITACCMLAIAYSSSDFWCFSHILSRDLLCQILSLTHISLLSLFLCSLSHTLPILTVSHRQSNHQPFPEPNCPVLRYIALPVCPTPLSHSPLPSLEHHHLSNKGFPQRKARETLPPECANQGRPSDPKHRVNHLVSRADVRIRILALGIMTRLSLLKLIKSLQGEVCGINIVIITIVLSLLPLLLSSLLQSFLPLLLLLLILSLSCVSCSCSHHVTTFFLSVTQSIVLSYL